jgi:hypothetical protein
VILEEAGPACALRFRRRRLSGHLLRQRRDLYKRGIHTATRFTAIKETAPSRTSRKSRRAGNAYGLGCIWGDYDNDGFPDLYVTQYGKNILYHNNETARSQTSRIKPV